MTDEALQERLDILEARMLALELAVASQLNVVAEVTTPGIVFDCGHYRLNTAGQCEACGVFVSTD